jgi:tetratricopeptide (TPR) repeat protein
VALQAGGQYEQASAHFGNVPVESPYYEEARYRRALCARLALESERDALAPAALRARALNVAGQLAQYAEQAERRADGTRDPSSVRAWAAAARVGAAEVLVSPGVARYQQALDLLADFEQRYDDRTQVGRVLAARITAHRALGDYEQAARVVTQFLRTVPPDQAGGTLAVIARGMQEEVERLEQEGDDAAARRVADQSIPIFEQLETWVRADTGRATYLGAVQYGLARMYFTAGQHDSARELTARLLERDSRDGNYQRLNARVLTAALGEQPAPQRLAEARAAWGVLLRDPELRTAAPERYWEARYHYLELMLREGKAAEVENAIRQDRVWYPDREPTAWDEKLNGLYERAVAELD